MTSTPPSASSPFGDPRPDLPPSDQGPPPPRAEIFAGPLGEIARIIRPHTEADPLAIVVSCLVLFGNIVGRTAHWVVESTIHFLNEYVTIVGASGKARKGSSLQWARRLLRLADPDWDQNCVVSGLVTGAGIIAEVHDPLVQQRPVKDRKSGRIIEYEEVIRDHGIADKRRLFAESEIAQVFSRAGTISNSLSSVLRAAFDGERLAVKTKSRPQTATGAHISVIGHSTVEEIQETLSAIDRANGLGNRFVYVYARRSGSVPTGSEPTDEEVRGLQEQFTRAVAHAKTVGNIPLDAEADELWRAIYPDLSAARPGPSGTLLSRGEVHVRRIACLYALMGLSAVVRRVDLEAALALWAYSEASVRYIFDRPRPDPFVDKVLGYLRDSTNGMTRGDLRDRLGNNVLGSRITQALENLRQRGLAQVASIPGPGRHAEHWSAVAPQPPALDPAPSPSPAPQQTGGSPRRHLPMKVKFDFGNTPPPEADSGQGSGGSTGTPR